MAGRRAIWTALTGELFSRDPRGYERGISETVLLRGPRDGAVVREADSAVVEIEIDGYVHR